MAPKAKARSSTSNNLISKTSFTSTKSLSAPTKSLKKSASTTSSTSSASASTTDAKAAVGGLDVKAYAKLFKSASKEMGTPIHGEEFTPIDVILKVWDCQEEWGPASNIPRLERYERAERLGLSPPPEIGEILRSEEGRNKPEYSQSVFRS